MIKIRPRTLGAALSAVTVLMASVLNASPAQAVIPYVSLAGSTFEIDTDANLKFDGDNPIFTKDWGNVTEFRKDDKLSGSTDDSFGQGAKENSPVPTVVSGSIPPKKSDLKTFGVYQEGSTSNGFLNLFWSRIQDPSGTTNMDFEFNQLSTKSTNGVTPIRSEGDLLIIYDLSQGGTHPHLFLRTWNGSAWVNETDLTDSAMATGSINTSTIPFADSDGLGQQDPRTFGEAQIALSAIFPDPNVCETFGSAYLKSRSSDSFTAELKDFIAPVGVNISNCGSIKITKTDELGALNGATFVLYTNVPPLTAPRGAGDNLVPGKTCTTAGDGTCIITNVTQGDYWVVETVVPPGHDPVADTAVHVNAQEQVAVGPLLDPRNRGAIKITKTRKHQASGTGDKPHAGVSFQVDGGTAKVTDLNGVVCFDGLTLTNHTVHEVTPTGYQANADVIVAVDNAASCSDNPYAGETQLFSNIPLSNISVTFTSQVSGGTAADITCTGLTATPPDNSPGFNDTTENFNNLIPGTYTCTVIIDP